jgi:hypothetical protein
MPKAVQAASSLLSSDGWLVLMTTEPELKPLRTALGETFDWQTPILLPGSENGLLVLIQSRTRPR